MSERAFAQMASIFAPQLLVKARAMVALGQVLRVRFSDGLLKARVKDSSHGVYDVFADLKSWPKIDTRCGCALSRPCIHLAMAMVALDNDGSKPQKPALDSQSVVWFSDLHEKKDGFQYSLGIEIGQKQIDLLPVLLQMAGDNSLESLATGNKITLDIDEDHQLSIPWEKLEPVLSLLRSFWSNASFRKTKRIDGAQALALMQVERQFHIANQQHDKNHLKTQFYQLVQAQQLPEVSLPCGLKATLRDYQYQGFLWLQHMRQCRLNGVLADDMGLGKTIQTLTHLLYEKEQGRMQLSMIVVPTSLLNNWQAEAERFAPTLNIAVFHGVQRDFEKIAHCDLIITTYGLISRDYEQLKNCKFYYLILDEAQWIKNHKTKTTRLVKQLQAQHRLCLSGTPLENHLGELWSLFSFLHPGLLGGFRYFRQNFQLPIEKKADADINRQLLTRVNPLILRRTKKQVLPELPPKTETIIRVTLSDYQKDLYDTLKSSIRDDIRQALKQSHTAADARFMVLNALLRLRQVCCDARLLPDVEVDSTARSAKLDGLLSILETAIEEGRRVLVFSQFTSMLHLIAKALEEAQYPFLMLTGATKNRQTLIDTFQEGDTPIFLISLKAGGVGLNLTEADIVVHYDPWWNPVVQEQATARSHRLGQTKPVFVYKIIAKDTIEERILTLQQEKKARFDSIFGTTNKTLPNLSKEEILQLFD